MADADRSYRIFPQRQKWTHLALQVKDIEASIAWYQKHTHLELLSRNESDFGLGAWLGDRTEVDSPFILVISQFFEGKDPFAPAVHHPLGPFAHMGIEVTERQTIDDIVAAAKEDDCLALGPTQMPPPVGYICFIKDPDGNIIEFSFDQGVYEKAKEVWGSK